MDSQFLESKSRFASPILVVGVSVRALVESAVHANYAVIAVDAFGDMDLRSQVQAYSLHQDFGVPYSPRALFNAGRQLGCAAVAYTSNLENHPEVLDLFAAGHSIIGNPPDVIRSVRDWADLSSRLDNAGFPVPETIYSGGNSQFSREERWIVKPVLSGGGHGISFFDGDRPAGKDTMLQRYIPGKSCSASFVSNGCEAVVIGITEQLIGMGQFGVGDFRYCGSILPLREALEPETGEAIFGQVQKLAGFLTREFDLVGVNGFDFILERGRVCLIEVNPRYTASMELVEQAYGLAIFDLHVQAVMDGRLPEFRLESLLNRNMFFGKGILFSRKNMIVPAALNFHERGAKDIPQAGEEVHPGSPVCTLLSCGATYEDTLSRLIGQAELLEEQIYG